MSHMKIKDLACIASILLASLSGSSAATTLTAWTFDNLSLGANGSPSPATGFGTASVVGLSSSSIVSLPGSSTPGFPYSLVVSNGWSTNAAIGSQGAQFAASTVGYYQIQLSFDVYATTNAEAKLQVQYATDGNTWVNANITSAGAWAGNPGVLATNTNPTNGIVVGTYLILTNNSGAAVWNTNVTVNLSGISGVDNDSKLTFRIVNAAKNTNCLDTTGIIFTNTTATATWTFDNVVVSGVSFDTVADWTFESGSNYAPHPVPEVNPLGNTTSAQALGMTTSWVFANGVTGSTNNSDISAQAGSTTPTATATWRIRGGGPGNGWFRAQPIFTQGAQFNVSTLTYTNILVSFDLFSSSQGEAKFCVIYTTDGWVTTNVANNISYGANPSFIVSNAPVNLTDYTLGGSSNTVTGTYVNNTVGQGFMNNVIVDFTGVAAVQTNANFGFAVVNAATGNDCTGASGGYYNNSSGNWRFDNVAVSGQFQGSPTPVLTNAPSATVDNPFILTFADDSAWRGQIGSILVNGAALPTNAYAISAGQITLIPSNSAVLKLSGLDYIVVNATNYVAAKVTQPVLPGVFAGYTFTQPKAPSASGGTLTVNPTLVIADQYGNGSTNPYASITITATVSNSPATWTLGGTTTAVGVNGTVSFTNLSATLVGASAVSNAAINFTITGGPIAATNSTAFVIGVAPVPFTPGNLAVLQSDTTGNNTTFSIIEVKPSAVGQTKPVNIVPISATGANPLRFANAGSGGKLALSDNGKFLCFGGYQDGSAATPDETFNQYRAVGTLDYTNKFIMQAPYYSLSFGGSQVRAACSPDNSNFVIDDKYGLYVNTTASYVQNNIGVRSFGGLTWVLTAKTHIPAIPCFYQFASGSAFDGSIDWGDPGDNGEINNNGTPAADSVAQDFYMISSNGTYNIVYIIDQNAGGSATNGIITKYAGTLDGTGAYDWVSQGSWTNTDNAETLFATTNGSGGVYLYYANGTGKNGNSIIRLTDATVGGSLNIISTNTIYTAPGNTAVYGITFVPQATAYATELTPPPILTAQATAPVSGNIYITNTPDDGNWRGNITAITVNGALLPTTAYNTNTAGYIVLIPSASTLLQTNGSKTIVITATGYSTNSVTQVLAPGAPTKLVMKTEPSASVGAGAAFGTPPAVNIEDTYGNVVATATSNIVAQVGTGTGSLSGTTTIAAVSGVATFTSALLAPTVAQTGLKLAFTSAGLASVTNTTSITVNPGAANRLAITTQPAAPLANGGALATQPVAVIQDQYGNLATTATSNIVAQVGAGTWTIGGTTTQAATSGTATFAGLTAASAAAVTGATISFTSIGLTGATSAGFNIPAPVQSMLGGAKLSGGQFIFTFTNTPGLTILIKATNDITAPRSSWPVVGTAVENPAGTYQYTNPAATTGQQFFISQP